ncbi:MAG: sulfatase [Candidatus Aminicenantes bacterium]|nr:sulfatase [Candidatus Aminicenantes bacterium]
MISRIKLLCIVLLLFLLPWCKKEKEQFKHIEPQIKNGITLLRFNNLGKETAMQGKWSAPVLGKNKKFARTLDYPGGSIFFYAPEKERYFAHLTLQGEADSFDIKIGKKTYTIGEDSEKGGVRGSSSGKKHFFVIDRQYIEKGLNRLQFIFKKRTASVPYEGPGEGMSGQVDRKVRSLSKPSHSIGKKNRAITVEELELYPKRLAVLKKKTKKGQIFTPAEICYYLNPNIDKKIVVQLDLGKLKKIDAQILVQSEKSSRKITKSITGGAFALTPIDDTFHKFTINLPAQRNKFVTLKKSALISRGPAPGSTPWKQIKKSRLKDKNVLFILLDAARADHFSLYGYSRKTTPNIDRLARTAVCFSDCYAESAYTLASTGTLLTGLPPDFHGVTSAFHSRLDEKMTTLPALFKKKGFFTGAVSANPYFGTAYNYNKGFENFVELFQDKKLVLAAEFIEPFEKMLQKRGDRPFFIYLHLREPHTDFLMPPPYLGSFQAKYKQQSKELKQEVDKIYYGRNNSKEQLQLITDLYDENLLYADAVVGKLLAILKKHGVYDKTIKVILSDHGEGLGEHGLVGHNLVLYKEGLHIPLIIDIPGLELENRFIDAPAVTSDLVVTLSEMFDLPYPYYEYTAGKNLFALPESRLRISRSMPLVSKYHGYMVEALPYRLIFFPPYTPAPGELYQVLSDPLERNKIEPGGIAAQLLFSRLDHFLNYSKRPSISRQAAKLRQKDLENLKALGYLD